VTVTGGAACQIVQSGEVDWSTVAIDIDACAVPVYNPATVAPAGACAAACGNPGYQCTLPDDYLGAYVAAQPPATLIEVRPEWTVDGGVGHDACLGGGSDSGAPVCPAISGTVTVSCVGVPCVGRWTSGVETPRADNPSSLGEYFARCSYFEAASVYAFERLAAELAAHGAPARLVRAAYRAARDEARHARRTRALARRYGVEPAWPEAAKLPVRPLVEMARENAAEGCVRETYGAVLGLVGAARAQDAQVRAVMRTIARDECRHAGLSWRVDAWAASRLGPRDQEEVRRAMTDAVRELLTGDHDGLDAVGRVVAGMPSQGQRRCIASRLEETLFRRAA
jgi:hypothetical protein